MLERSPAQIAYEADCAACPAYHDGTPRKSWSALSDIARLSWERNPTPRDWVRHGDVANDHRV